MATASASVGQSEIAPARRSSVVLLLRLEGLAVAALSAAAYARTGASWWLFAALWMAPDLSMLGYVGGSPCRGARVYNAFHTYVLPGMLALAAIALHKPILMVLALVWINHIGVDRLLGFGLKYADGFVWTHLSSVGRKAR